MKKYNKDSFNIKTLREWTMFITDLVFIGICFILSVILGQAYMLDNGVSRTIIENAFIALPVALALFFVSFVAFRVNKVVWRYARGRDYLRLVFACAVATAVFALIDQLLGGWVSGEVVKPGEEGSIQMLKAYPVYINVGFTTMGVTVVYRLFYEMIYAKLKDKALPKQRKRTMIVGAGYTASAILEELARAGSIYKPVCLVDDDPDKQGRILHDIEVVGTTKEIPRLARKYDVACIIFAIPSINPQARQTILATCMQTGCQLKVLPYLSEMIANVDLVGQAKEINIGDLLGREQISFNDSGVKGYIEDKVCMITGGGGSIGSELVRQIVKYKPRRIIVLDVYENCAYSIQQEILRNYGSDYDLNVEIASITDYGKMKDLFEQYHPQIIFHAAAHKHVPLMETNPEEAVKNNVFGTLNVVKLSYEYGVKKFIMISTDKAVNPTNVMGATKRCCEKIIEMFSQKYGNSGTEFAAVRFGNVLGSNGSVIPLFREQIRNGGPVTVTHPEIIRYFMTIPEAVSLVLQAGAYAHGGEVFVLDMGEPVKIVTLAENMIRMMGYTPYEDIQIKFTGLRPGEKLYEELLMKEEGLRKTDNNKIFIGKQATIDIDAFMADLEEMRAICNTNDKEKVIEKLKVLVPTFHHDTAYLELMRQKELQYQREYSGEHAEAAEIVGEQAVAEKEEDKKSDSDKKEAEELFGAAAETTATDEAEIAAQPVVEIEAETKPAKEQKPAKKAVKKTTAKKSATTSTKKTAKK